MKHKQLQNTHKTKANTVKVENRNIVGIDIGKRIHAATAMTPKGIVIAKLKSFENNRLGVNELVKLVLKPATTNKKPLIAMEATGHYWNALYDELQRRGYECTVLNPIQTNARMNSRIRKTKTDSVDSEVIARTILAGDALATVVPDEAMYELRLLVRHRFRLAKVSGMILRYAMTLLDRTFPELENVFSKPFLSSIRKLIKEIGLTPRVLLRKQNAVRELLYKASRGKFGVEKQDELFARAKESIGSRIGENVINSQLAMIVEYFDFVDKQIDVIEAEIKERLSLIETPLRSLGLGDVVIAILLAEGGDISQFAGPQQFTAFCGLDPSVYDSGDSVRGKSRISKRGSPLLRWAMFMGAQTVSKKHNDFERIYKRHSSRGKGHKYCLIVIAHKLARVIWRLVKDGREFSKRPPTKAVK